MVTAKIFTSAIQFRSQKKSQKVLFGTLSKSGQKQFNTKLIRNENAVIENLLFLRRINNKHDTIRFSMNKT